MRSSLPLLLLAAAGPRVVAADVMSSVNEFFMSTFNTFPELGPALQPYEVKLRNTKWIFSTINREPAASSLKWPSDEIKKKAGRDAWGDWQPKPGMKATVLHGWGSGKKWLLHFQEADKYMVVGDQVISSNYKEGRQKWNDYHVHRSDPRHIRQRTRRELEAKYRGEDVQSNSKEKCTEGGSMVDDIPTWVIFAIFCVVTSFAYFAFKFCTTEYEQFVKSRSASMQAAGESSEETKKTPKKTEKKKE